MDNRRGGSEGKFNAEPRRDGATDGQSIPVKYTSYEYMDGVPLFGIVDEHGVIHLTDDGARLLLGE